jgi:uncharacterized protein YdaU (DUF1376 family)
MKHFIKSFFNFPQKTFHTYRPMSKSPAFQFYVQDFLLGTTDFTAEEVGGYIRLLSYQWDKGGLPNDDSKLSKMSGVKVKNLSFIKEKFNLDEDGKLRNHRLERERNKQVEWRRKSSEAGRKSAQAKRNQKLTTVEPTLKNGINQTPTLHSSSSSSSSNTSITTAAVALGMHAVKPVANEAWSDQQWREGICMACSITESELKKWMAQFNSSVCNDSFTDFTASRYKKLFRGFVNKEKSKGVSVTGHTAETPTIPSRHVKLNS